MKRVVLLTISIIGVFISVAAQNCTLRMTNGQTVQGTLIDANDSTLTFMMEGATQAYTLHASRIKSGTLPHKGKISVIDGKIIIQTGDEIKAAQNKQLANNPNYAIGKALKVSGATSLGIGIPCLAAGLATCIAGNVMYVTVKD